METFICCLKSSLRVITNKGIMTTSQPGSVELVPATMSVPMVGASNATTIMDTTQNKTQFDHIDGDVDAHTSTETPDSQMSQQSRDALQARSSAATPSSLTIQELHSSRYHESHAKIDGLSVDMNVVKMTLEEPQQGSPEDLSLQQDPKQVQLALQLARERCDKFEKKWKQAASQLDQLRYKGTETCQLADSDLTRQVLELRYQIRNFSYEYFQGKVRQQRGDTSDKNFWKYMAEVTSTRRQDQNAELMSETKRPFVIQAFLWRLLIGEVFGKFCWTPFLRESIIEVYEALRPAYKGKSNPEIPTASGADEKFRSWNATTSALILESIQNKSHIEANSHETKLLVYNFSDQILDVIWPFTKGPNERVPSCLQSIIGAAIALDQNICTQVASIDWIFAPSKSQVHFDPNFMEQERVAVASRSEKCVVDMVLAPALVKRSKCIGKSPEMEDWLVKMAVTCVPFSGDVDTRGHSQQLSGVRRSQRGPGNMWDIWR